MTYRVPSDAQLIFPLHFRVHNCCHGNFHAEATLEVQTVRGYKYFTVCATGRTYRAAMRKLISLIETSHWFRYFKLRKIYFKVTGEGMHKLYKGYL